MGTSSSKSKAKKGNEISEADKAVLSLKTQKRKLVDYQKKVERVIARETEIARELLAKKKRDRALTTLKKKKMQEAQLAHLDQWIFNVEQMLGNIEQAQLQGKVLEAIKEGNDQVKAMQKEISVEEVEQLMDETVDAKEYLARVNEAVGEISEEAEGEAEEELAALEAEILVEDLPEVPKEVTAGAHHVKPTAEAGDLPDVPKTDPVHKTAAEKERIAVPA